MSETKHTSGPWRWTFLIEPHRDKRFGLTADGGCVLVPDSLNNRWDYIDITGADAQLIAAAPDLLDACKVAWPYLRTDAPRAVLFQILAALHKATGDESYAIETEQADESRNEPAKAHPVGEVSQAEPDWKAISEKATTGGGPEHAG